MQQISGNYYVAEDETDLVDSIKSVSFFSINQNDTADALLELAGGAYVDAAGLYYRVIGGLDLSRQEYQTQEILDYSYLSKPSSIFDLIDAIDFKSYDENYIPGNLFKVLDYSEPAPFILPSGFVYTQTTVANNGGFEAKLPTVKSSESKIPESKHMSVDIPAEQSKSVGLQEMVYATTIDSSNIKENKQEELIYGLTNTVTTIKDLEQIKQENNPTLGELSTVSDIKKINISKNLTDNVEVVKQLEDITISNITTMQQTNLDPFDNNLTVIEATFDLSSLKPPAIKVISPEPVPSVIYLDSSVKFFIVAFDPESYRYFDKEIEWYLDDINTNKLATGPTYNFSPSNLKLTQGLRKLIAKVSDPQRLTSIKEFDLNLQQRVVIPKPILYVVMITKTEAGGNTGFQTIDNVTPAQLQDYKDGKIPNVRLYSYKQK